MASSMTAFARAESGNITWELRSVNHRFLELSFRMPDGYRELENPLRQSAKGTLNRGKIDATMRIAADGANDELRVDQPKLVNLLATLAQLRRDAPQLDEPDALDVLRWPGILAEDKGTDEALKASIRDAFHLALSGLAENRQREGAHLEALLRERLDEIGAIVAKVRQIAAGLDDKIRQRLIKRVSDIASDAEVNLDNDRIEQEVVLLLQKADVAEELDRLDIHVAESRACLDGAGPHGRRLDFLIQELNREANTLGSKAVLPECSQSAVDLKVLIEQMREQVQNLE